MLTTQTPPRRTRAALLFRAVATSRNSPNFSSKLRPTVFSPISEIGASCFMDGQDPPRAPTGNHGRCGCFHCKWKQPRALVSVWSSRVGPLPPWREIRSSRHRRQRRLLVPVAQNLSCLCLLCLLCWFLSLFSSVLAGAITSASEQQASSKRAASEQQASSKQAARARASTSNYA